MNRYELLSYCELLLDASSIGTDYVDATDSDVGMDGLAGLDSEGSYGESTHVDNTYISLAAERRGDGEHVPADGEGEVALAGAVVRRVLLFTEGEGRVVFWLYLIICFTFDS